MPPRLFFVVAAILFPLSQSFADDTVLNDGAMSPADVEAYYEGFTPQPVDFTEDEEGGGMLDTVGNLIFGEDEAYE